MSALWLVRHARSVPQQTLPPQQWLLADEQPELRALASARVFPPGARWFTSPEPKAVGTAAGLTDGWSVVDDLRENVRGVTWFDDPDEFAVTVRQCITRPDLPALPSWEPAVETTTRVVAAVRTIVEDCPGQDVVLVGHGTAWTLLVAALTAGPPDLDAWQRMRMPDVCRLEGGRVTDPWGTPRS